MARAILLAWCLAVCLVLVATPWLWWQGGMVETVVPAAAIHPCIRASFGPSAFCFSSFALTRQAIPRYLLKSGPLIRGFFFESPVDVPGGVSELLLFADGKLLGPRLDDATFELGSGSYTQMSRVIAFSTSDGTHPRANGRTYSFRGYLRPRLAALPIAILALFEAFGACLLIYIVRRREELMALYAGQVGELGAIVLLIGVFSGYAFLGSRLDRPRTAFLQLAMASLAAGILWWRRQGLLIQRWMVWPFLFLLWCTVRLAIDPDPTGSWSLVGRLWLGLSLGVVVWSALAGSLLRVSRSLAVPLAALFMLATTLIAGQNLGFDWKGFVLSPSTGLIDSWTKKYSETWFLCLAWALVAVVGAGYGPRGRRGLLIFGVLASCGLALGFGYSDTNRVVFGAGLLLFLLARRFPQGSRRAVVGAMLLLLVSGPALGPVAWRLYSALPEGVHAKRFVKEHVASRVLAWRFAGELIHQRPFVGWGPGAGLVMPEGRQTVAERWPGQVAGRPAAAPVLPGGHPHNLPLLLWLETGALGVLCALGFVWAVHRRLRRLVQPEPAAAYLTLVASVFGIFFLNYPALDPAPFFLLVMVASSAASLLGDGPAGRAS